MRAKSDIKVLNCGLFLVTVVATSAVLFTTRPAQAAEKKPNILVIMGDDAGWFNVGGYHRGIMSGRTPNLDMLAAGGMLFTDYYAEASCTAGRANFITAELPIRTGLTTVGQAGADVGMPDQAVTLATVLKELGYTTRQFGKNHLGDLNKYLPTLHGFDEFFGYLYHLDAMSDPYWFDYPQDWIDKYGPRDLLHCWATDVDDPTEMPRWGKVGKQRIVDEGPLAPFPDMAGIRGSLPSLPVPPVAEGAADKIRDSLQALLQSEAQELAAAIRASVEANVSTAKAELTARVNQLKAQLAGQVADFIIGPLNRGYSFYDSWADPVIGLRGRLNLTKAIYLTAETDVGGFGIGSDIAVGAYAALGCQLTRNIFSEVGYRYLYDDFRDESVGYLYQLTLHGPQLTIGLKF